MSDSPRATPCASDSRGASVRLGALLLFVGAFFIAWTVLAKTIWYSPVKPWLDAELGKQAADVALSCFKAFVWLGSTFAFLRWSECPDMLASVGLRNHAGRGLIIGVAIGALSIAKDVVRVTYVEHETLTPTLDPTALVIMVIGAPFIEEVLFRGCMLQALRQHCRFWLANLAQSILFLAIHLPGWFFAGTLTNNLHPGTSLSIFALGFVQGYLFKWTGSLWPCVLLHLANNYGARL